MRIVPILSLALLASGLSAQDTAKDVFEQVTATQQQLLRGASRAERAQAMAKAQEAAKEALTANATLLGEGEGLHYRARIQMLARADSEDVLASLNAHIASAPKSDLANESRVLAMQLVSSSDTAAAKKLASEVDTSKLGEQGRRMFDALQGRIAAGEKRDNMNGNPPPAFAASMLLNGGSTFASSADFSLEKLKGKVVVIDFWATWCPPCRAVIPDLVKMQAAHADDGLVVIGATRYYGYGMDFSADSQLPHGGKSVGGRADDQKLSEEAEITVNEHFISAFEVNYPIVFTEGNVAGDLYGVQGIPTLFVIGRDGNVIGHVVGSGEANHEKVVKWVSEALGNKAVEAAGHKK